VERGDHTVIETFPGEKLDNPYSMNVVDICPVGALTNRDFRFKSRVWEMSFTDSVCQGCARGCNIEIGVRNNEILRLTPRRNEDVNSYWMCDHGRMETFKSVNADTRIKAPMVRRDAGLVDVDWDEAIAKVASELKSFKKSEIAVLGSAFATNEDNFAVQRLAKEVLGTKNVDFMRHIVEGDEDNILIRADKTPNSTGAKAVGVAPAEGGMAFQEIIQAVKEGKIKALYALEDNIAMSPDVADALSKLEFFAVHASNKSATTDFADVVLASSTYAEKNGTVTNFQERVQRIRPAVTTLEQDRALDGFEMSRWDRFAAPNDSWGKGPRRDARPSWKIITILAALMGAKFKYNSSDEVFADIAQKVDGFKGLTYPKIGTKGMVMKAKAGVTA